LEKWREIQKQNFHRVSQLLQFLKLEETLPVLNESKFPFNLPLRLAKKMEKGNPNDPLLKQFLPHQNEAVLSPHFLEEPVQDTAFQMTPRLLKKYEGRALMMPTSACVMNCRFCFRQNYPYEKTASDFEAELKALANDSSLYEIILSGGDPLSLSDENLNRLMMRLDAIPHLKILRFHTRFPLGIPERITPAFLERVKKMRLQVVFILHVNHPRELDDDILSAMEALRRNGAMILTQTVLLREVNDDAKTLETLFLSLVERGIVPYYLHQLDRVQGTHHFDVPEEKGLKLIEELRASLPGYAVPQYVKEVPFKKNKLPIFS